MTVIGLTDFFLSGLGICCSGILSLILVTVRMCKRYELFFALFHWYPVLNVRLKDFPNALKNNTLKKMSHKYNNIYIQTIANIINYVTRIKKKKLELTRSEMSKTSVFIRPAFITVKKIV